MAARVSQLNVEFPERRVKIGEQKFTLRSLSISDYDDCLKKATTTRPDPVTGEDRDFTDNQALLRFMVMKCVVSPKMTPDVLGNLPTPIAFTLNRLVNEMHFDLDSVKVEDIEDEEDEEGADDKGEG